MAETYSFDLKMKMTDKEKHRLSQFLQPALDLRRFARFVQQSMKFEELEKKEKYPLRKTYYEKLKILKHNRAMFYFRRYWRVTL
jgi:hypothetical protein